MYSFPAELTIVIVFSLDSPKNIKKLQLIQNAAARVLTRTRRTEHITPILKSRAASVGNEFSHRFVESHDY